MSQWTSAKHEVHGEIMKTDVFITLVSDTVSKEEMERDIAAGFRSFRDFAERFSRFDTGSELSCFNASEGGRVSPELFFLLKECRRFYGLTGGIFDPSVLPVLERIGYGNGLEAVCPTETVSFDRLTLDEETLSASKPAGLRIDLGGIGKGYIVDRVAEKLMEKYENGIVDAGGDMRVFGGDRERRFDHWVIDVEDPFAKEKSFVTLTLSGCAVATSGTSRRHWRNDGKTRHHLIDPRRQTDATSDLVQVTVIAPRTAEADIFAKTLFILGLGKGQAFATERALPALFVTKEKTIVQNEYFQSYEWQA